MKKSHSLIISTIVHITAIAIALLTITHTRAPKKRQPTCFVDIIQLPGAKKKARGKTYTIASNTNREANSPIHSRREKIPISAHRHYATPNSKKATVTETQRQSSTKVTTPKNYVARHNRIIKIPGPLFSKSTVYGITRHMENTPSGTSKAYSSRNTFKETSVSIGTTLTKYASYMEHIKNKIQDVWTYPEYARESNEEGSLIVLFTIGRNGEVLDIKLLRSSGYPVLDKAAIQAVKEAAPFPLLPKRFNIDRLNIYATFIYTINFYSIR